MCINNLEDWQVRSQDTIAYKLCRVDHKGQFRSKLRPQSRMPQERYNQGTDEIYRLNKQKKSSRIGYYCYRSMRAARYHADLLDAILRVVIPSGVRYRLQSSCSDITFASNRGKAILAKSIVPIAVVKKGKY